MVTSFSLEVQGPGSPYPSLSGASNCLGMFGVYAGIIFQKIVLATIFQFQGSLVFVFFACSFCSIVYVVRV